MLKKWMKYGSMMAFAMLAVVPAAFAGAADPFAGGLSTVQGWFAGSLAQLIALIALIVGVILAIGGRITTALAAFALALIIGLGDTVVAALATL